MPERMTFTLTGRDELSRVLNGAGTSADRLRLRLAGMAQDANGNLRDLRGNLLTTDEATRRLADSADRVRPAMMSASDHAKKLGEALKAGIISLAPAAIPAVAGLAGAAAAVAGQLGAAGLATVAYGVALAPQVAAIGEVTKAHDAYEDAVAASGAGSQEAAQAQRAYQQQLAKLPPETQRAAVAVGLLRDNFDEWSDSLAGDVMGPFNKGVAVANALLPKTTGLVQGASGQFDRLVTLVGGAIESPGFDKLNTKLTDFSERTLDHAVDELTIFLARLDTGEVGGQLEEFLDYCREQGPVVGDTLRNLGEALLNVLEAGSEVGVGMLQVINALSSLIAAVPPGAIAVFLQLAIAIKAVKLAAAGSSALAAVGLQIRLMQAAATGTPGRLAAVGAAISTLSRTAKIAMAGTGIGLLLIALGELSARGKNTPPDVDKLTTSLAELGSTGKVTGEALKAFGTDFADLRKQLDLVINPSVTESFNNWGSKISQGLLDGGDATEDLKGKLDSLDESLAALVSDGKADLAKASLEALLKGMDSEQVDKIKGSLDGYKEALAGAALEQRLAAESQGLFGIEAQKVQTTLDAQKASTDGLRESIIALNDVNRAAQGGMIGFEQAIDDASKASGEHKNALQLVNGELNLNTQASRDVWSAQLDLAAKTDAATAAARDSGASWSEVSTIYERGRQQLIKNLMQQDMNRESATRLANQILKTPNKTAFLRGDLKDLQGKLDNAKRQLRSVPDSRKAGIRATIAQLEAQIAAAQRQLNNFDGRRATAVLITEHRTIYTGQGGRGPNAGATGGLYTPGGFRNRYSTGGLVKGPGTGTSDSILAPWLSNGEFVIRAASVKKYGVDLLSRINGGRIPVKAGRAAAVPAKAVATPLGAGGTQASFAGLTDAIRAAIAASATSLHGQQLRLVLDDGTQLTAHIEALADNRIRRSTNELVQVLNAGGGG